MRRVVVDCSALAAVVFQEEGFLEVSRRLAGAELFAPSLLKFELANVARNKARSRPADATATIVALGVALEGGWNLAWHEVDMTDVVLIANATGTTAYDASYLWLAGFLGADLVTLDKRLARYSDLASI